MSAFYDTLVPRLDEIAYSEANCTDCGSDFFRHSSSSSNNCGCCKVESGQKRHEANPLTIAEINKGLSDLALTNSGIFLQQPRHILNLRRNPLFITAGIQIIDDVIHDGAEKSTDTILVAQPSVRLNFLGKTDINQAFYTSFVNIAFAQTESSLASHTANLTTLLSFLDAIGVDLSQVTLQFRENQNNWGEGVFDSRILDLIYNGIGVGDAVLLQNYPQASREALTISDISFGIERLLLAVNQYTTEQDLFDDYTIHDGELLDLLKTSTLLIGSGVYPSSTYNPGRRVREVCKRIATKSEWRDDQSFIGEAFEVYWGWWKRFAAIDVEPDDIHTIVQEEISSLKHKCVGSRSYRAKVNQLQTPRIT